MFSIIGVTWSGLVKQSVWSHIT